jgi:hypothetical protein
VAGRGRIPAHRLLTAARAAILALLSFAAFLPSLSAGDLQTWSDLEYDLVRLGRFQWQVGGRFRFAETIGDLYDRRAVTMIEYGVGKGVIVGGGYVFQHRREGGFSFNQNRLVAGITYPILRRALTVEGTTLYERHVVPLSDFNRYKQEFEASQHEKPFSPWVYQQFTFRQGAGFVRSRSRLGFRWKSSFYSFKAAYQFESLSTGTAWVPRHTIYTEVSIDRPVWERE